MNAHREIEFGAEGIGYVTKCLELGKTLSKLLLQIRDLNTGRVVTRLPSDLDDATAKDFETGGKLPPLSPRTTTLQPVPNTDLLLSEEIQVFLAAGDRNVCIFEDASASPSDPFLHSLDTRYVTFEDEVYHLLCQADKDQDSILATVRRAHSWLFIGVLTSAPPGVDLCSEGVLTKSLLKFLAEEARKIVVGAYDGEAYLIWTRT